MSWLWPKSRVLLATLADPNYQRAMKTLENVGRLHAHQISTLMRTPQPDTPWMDKFLALDKDYMALEKELQAARVEAFAKDVEWKMQEQLKVRAYAEIERLTRERDDLVFARAVDRRLAV